MQEESLEIGSVSDSSGALEARKWVRLDSVMMSGSGQSGASVIWLEIKADGTRLPIIGRFIDVDLARLSNLDTTAYRRLLCSHLAKGS
jgi:hypothetical protein